ncbi:MAG TPA: four helix bundle protein [Chitinophagaceae bacterium]|jgi:four helix bundle protein|nr:four helix bundle protein [Chitinophagaceae bacterium]
METLKRWRVSELAFQQQSELFILSKTFPKEELYSLTSQIRRSSRSVCANLAEAYRKKRYPPHFISKLTDADAENSETDTWLDIAFSCGYVDGLQVANIKDLNVQIGKLIGFMLQNTGDFLHDQ